MNDWLKLQVLTGIEELGPDWDSLFAAGAGLQSSRAWFSASIQAALPAGTRPQLVAISDRSGPLALVPMRAGPGRAHGSLTTPYTCLYQPLIRPAASAAALTLPELGRYFRRHGLTRFEALDPDWPGVGLLQRSSAHAGLTSRSFAHFGNWYEPIATRSWEAYLHARPGALRETIRRRTRAATRAGIDIVIAREGQALTAALDGYESVYRRSWKQAEPYPHFNSALVRALSPTGLLRIGVLIKDGTPIAAQYWSVVGGSATILKLAHDEEFKAFSPGTVLTAATIRELIEVDGVTELDFGRGDDAYKRSWVGCRRPRIGLVIVNPRTLSGLRELLRHDTGALLRWARKSAVSRDQAPVET